MSLMKKMQPWKFQIRVNYYRALTTKPLKSVVQGHSNLLKDLIEAQKSLQFISQASLSAPTQGQLQIWMEHSTLIFENKNNVWKLFGYIVGGGKEKQNSIS